MQRLPTTFILLLAIGLEVKAGCRYTNPEWEQANGTTKSDAPSVQVAVTSNELQLLAKWDASVVTQYPQCVDKIQLYTGGDVVICSSQLSEQKCESSQLSRDICSEAKVHFWLTLINEDHKDGP